ncbi:MULTISPECIES: DNA alkylation repair protein [Caproicibacterium]|jgi:3-methyladenine DNA glycosylase AlkD|uniref:DNA alkylation repair protein n=1 Tax=Caproicibacterium lactatifermentans TaxID=2666138 RepID=A0A859DVW6_9FIRM|nr:DNA alkylation repair protein [Caproicibacterium lactatifermentans]ARP49820.1 hypothetical protein B6259_02270 [Ruminococcaceae bacterium CPB6]MDD4807060.1 DNA alkylation repair protein [Oscillospiraceae bacterium]QKN24453.1 DNA alkylation repair protein [Caproicibacterium lactatifermentans]QKO30534.1 DNA alkylation repair protein [Caproicibacterium lactatifermentans]
MTIPEIEEELQCMAEPKYRDFSSRLLPQAAAEGMLGVRLPKLRQMAGKISKGDWQAFLQTCPDRWFEEIMLQGMVIGRAAKTPEEAIPWIQQFLPKIDNWSICDSFCVGLKVANRYPQQMWRFVTPYVRSEREYFARFGAVMLLDHFAAPEYAGKALQLLDNMRSTAYYAGMAAAWAVSVFYVHCPEITGEYLRHSHLSDAVYNQALQKIIESRRATPEQKTAVRAMKRKPR